MIRQAMALLIVVVLASAGSARAAEPPYILVDINSGQVLAERRSGELWYPASLAKLMTIYLLFQALAEDRLELDSPIIISETALRAPPSKMGFPAGTIITVENALKILIVKSANDVAIAVAEMMSGTERSFIAEMNRAGTRLGMIGTRFANPHGLPDDGQYTTARDMALLARMIWLGFPEYRDLFAIAEIRFGRTIMPAANSLLEFYPGATGMKTGFICAAGFNLVATATRGGRSLIAVVLGAASPVDRTIEAAWLFNAGFAGPAALDAPALSAFAPLSSVSTPISLRDTICAAGAGNNPEPADQRDLLITALGEPMVLPPPVPVFTGGADSTAYLRIFIPLPPPRPTNVLGFTRNPMAEAGVPLPRPHPMAELRR